MSDIRILQIAKHFYPDVGGIETVTKNISESLCTVGLSADVLCMSLHSSGDRQENGYRVMRSRSDAVLAGNKTFSWNYVNQVRRLSPHYDVAILHMPNPLGAAAALAGWRKPLILLWHADFDHRPLSLLTAPIDAAIARQADAIVAPTSIHLATSNRSRHLAGKGEAIPFPLARRVAAKSASPSALIETVKIAARKRPVVLAAGRLVPYKGFDVLVRAMQLIDIDLYCVIAGGGPLKVELEGQIAASALQDKITVTGQITDEEMDELLELACFGCLPSVTAQEMYGLTQVEMMSLGKPMVATRLAGSGVPLVNRHNETGLLATPGDAVDLARGLTALATDKTLYKRLAAGAARAYRTEHGLATVGAQYAALCRRLV